MDAKELTDMQKQETWDFGDDAEVRSRPRKARAVVSVAFPSEDFERVGQYAEAHGLKISELIRSATLAYVSGGAVGIVGQMSLMSAGGAAEMRVYFREMMPATVAGSASFDSELVRI